MTPCTRCPAPRLPTRGVCRKHYNERQREWYRRNSKRRRIGEGPCPYPGCGSTRFRYYEEQGRKTRRCMDCACRQAKSWKARQKLKLELLATGGLDSNEAAWIVALGEVG